VGVETAVGVHRRSDAGGDDDGDDVAGIGRDVLFHGM
jgi:hypothetical protein